MKELKLKYSPDGVNGDLS